MARSLARAVLAILAVMLLAAAPASAMSAKKANKAALAILKPKKTKGPVVVFALSKPLKKGDVVTEVSAKTDKNGLAKPAKGTKLKKRGRLFWMDLEYGFMFGHKSVLLVLDDKTGRPLIKKSLRFWPRVNGRNVPFAWGKGHASTKAMIFKRLEPKQAFDPAGPARVGAFRPLADAADTPAPNPRYANDCLYAIGGQSVPKSFENMIEYWNKLGVKRYGPSKPKPPKEHIDDAEIVGGINDLPDYCKDVIIYVSGHGAGDSILIEEKGTNGRPDELWMNLTDVVAIISSHRSLTFKLIVDACASGTYVDEVRRLLQREGATNLLIDVSATTGGQSALAYFGADGSWHQPLTETLIQGMDASEDPVDKDQSGVPAAARLIELGMANRPKSRAETWFGKTPQTHSNLAPYSVTPPPVDTYVCHSMAETCPKDNSTCDGGSTCSGNNSTCTGSGTTCGPGSGDHCSGGATCTGPAATCDGAGTECTQSDGSCTNGATCPAPAMKCSGTGETFNAPTNTGWSFTVQCDKPFVFIKFTAAGNTAVNGCCEPSGWTHVSEGDSEKFSGSPPVAANTNQSFGVDWMNGISSISGITAVASESADGSNPVTVALH
jgi:hypothetical protein